MPAIADQWTCMNIHCCNKGRTCWQQKKPNGPDLAENHYPVSGEIFQKWSKEIAKEISTVDQPSEEVVVQLVKWKERDRKKNPIEGSAKMEDSSTTNALLNAYLVTSLKQLNTPTLSTSSAPSSSSLCIPTSPIHSETDPQELLTQFFEYLMTLPGLRSEHKREALTKISNVLVEDEWEIDLLRESKDGKGMTDIRWESYGFKIGMLEKIRSHIKDFKGQRSRRLQSSSGSSSSI